MAKTNAERQKEYRERQAAKRYGTGDGDYQVRLDTYVPSFGKYNLEKLAEALGCSFGEALDVVAYAALQEYQELVKKGQNPEAPTYSTHLSRSIKVFKDRRERAAKGEPEPGPEDSNDKP